MTIKKTKLLKMTMKMNSMKNDNENDKTCLTHVPQRAWNQVMSPFECPAVKNGSFKSNTVPIAVIELRTGARILPIIEGLTRLSRPKTKIRPGCHILTSSVSTW